MNAAISGAAVTRALMIIVLVACAGRVAAVSPLTTAGTERVERPTVSLTAQNADQMVARLSDSEVRALLLEHLKQSAPTKDAAPAQGGAALHAGGVAAADRLHAMIGGVGALGGETSRLAVRIGSEGGGWLAVLAALVASFVGAAMIERFMRRRSGLIARLQRLPVPGHGEPLGLGRVLLDAAVRAVAAVIFLLGAVLVLSLVPGLGDAGHLLASGVVWLVAGTRVISALVHGVLLPARGISPWPLKPEVARTIASHVTIVAGVAVFNIVNLDLLRALGAAEFLTLTVRLSVGALLIAAVIWGIIAVRRSLGPTRSPDDGPADGLLALLVDQWHRLAILATIVIFALAVYRRLATGEPALMPALGSLGLLLSIPLFDFMLRAIADRLVKSPAADDRSGDHSAAAAEPDGALVAGPDGAHPAAPQPSLANYRHALLVNLRILLAIAIVKMVASLWGFQVVAVVESVFGAAFAGAVFQIGITCLFAFIVWQIVKAAVATYAAPAAEDAAEGGDGGGTGLTRTQTLLPILAKVVGGVLLVMVVMITLSALGVDIGPLLAGAGVVGLAVGFGAQTLVRDVVSGVFFLMDDAFRMGEYVTVDNIRGTVEKISVRSLRLRHHRGPVHTLPYGEISHITNYSRDYAVMAFEVRVPFETDVEKVRKLIKKVGLELMENEELAPTIIEPLKSQGVNRMDDSAFVIRCKFTTLPGKQFTVRRYAFAMIQDAFEAEGIQFAPRRVIVETRGARNAEEGAIAAAAADAVAPESRA